MTRVYYYVIFGAAVRPDGRPSGTLQRRVEGAWQLARQTSPSKFIVTGGQGKQGPTEGQVMKRLLLELGAEEQQILVEDKAQDTLESVLYCTEILNNEAEATRDVIVCSSPYHNYRCQMLFRLWGVPCRRGIMPSDRPTLGTLKWLYYYFREAAAIPWDFLHMCLLHLRHPRQTR